MLCDYKMKVIFNLKSGKKNELLLNLFFPETDGNGDDDGSEDKNSTKEKETENSVSFSSGYSYTPVMVRPPRLELGPKASEAFMVSNSTTGAKSGKIYA